MSEKVLNYQRTKNGELWFFDNIEKPVRIRQFEDSLMLIERYRTPLDHYAARILGTQENASLAIDLHERKKRGQIGVLQIASPQVCHSTEELQNPEIALYRMRQCLRSGSLGGWHNFDEADLSSYELAVAERIGESDCVLEEILDRHPVSNDMEFLATIDKVVLAKLIALILDPRWFVDMANPYRLSKLNTFLGLSPRYFRQLDNSKSKKATLGRLSRNCWKSCTSPSSVDIEKPGNFLWRRWRHHGGGWRGDLVATQTFIVFLTRIWLDHLVAKQRARQELQMFIPSMLLTEEETRAFLNHRQDS